MKIIFSIVFVNRDYEGAPIHTTTTSLLCTNVPEWSKGKLKCALDLHCHWIYGDGNEDIYIAGNADPEIENSQMMWYDCGNLNTKIPPYTGLNISMPDSDYFIYETS